MQAQSAEIYYVVVLGGVLASLLVGFLVGILLLYQRRRHRHEQELIRVKDEFEQELLKSQLEIQESTFKMIGQELHDNIGQMLSVIKLSLAILPVEASHSAYESLLNARQMLNKAIYDLADLNKSLHTDRIAQIGLVESVRFETDSVRRAKLMEVELEVLGTEYHLDQQKSIFLFRIFQEIMNNALKHSQATKIIVTIIYSEDNNFVLEVEDNGVGFDVSKKIESVSSASGVGLKSLYNRAKLIGAQITMNSEPGKGTIVTVEMPLPED